MSAPRRRAGRKRRRRGAFGPGRYAKIEAMTSRFAPRSIRLAVLLAAVLATRVTAADPPRTRAFTGARLFDGSGRTVEDATLVVSDGRIVAVGSTAPVPAGAEHIDLTGRFVMPGLVNAHGHVGATRGLRSGPELYSRQNVLDQLRLYARYGITTVVSLGDDRDEGFRVRDEQETASLDRARLYVAGPVVDATTPEAARAQVAALAARRPDWVKIRVDDTLGTTPKMTPAVYRAVIDEAHARGLRVAAHLFYLEDAQGLLAAGVDFIAHSVRDKPVDPAFVAALAKRGTCLCPTLMREVSAFAYVDEPTFFADPFFLKEADPAVVAELRSPERREQARANPASARYREALRTASLNLKTLVDGGVPIAMGTDTGPPARFQGYFEHEELARMVEAGLTPTQALVAATSGAARCLGLKTIGRLEPGAWADFLVLRADPLADIRNTKSLESAWIAGNRVPPR
jgi:imidazolonepropionase-like amidohydrolase